VAGNGTASLNGKTMPTNPKVQNIIEKVSDYWAWIRKVYSVPGDLYRLMCGISTVHMSTRSISLAYLPRCLINGVKFSSFEALCL